MNQGWENPGSHIPDTNQGSLPETGLISYHLASALEGWMCNSYFLINGVSFAIAGYQAVHMSLFLKLWNHPQAELCFLHCPSSLLCSLILPLSPSPRAATSLYGTLVKSEWDANALGVCDPVPGHLAWRAVGWLDFRAPQLPQLGSTTCGGVRPCSSVPILCHIKAQRQTQGEQAVTQAPCAPLPSP